MKQLVILSGKGGTGKTSIAAAHLVLGFYVFADGFESGNLSVWSSTTP